MRYAQGPNGLTEKEAALVDAIASGMSVRDASQAAGYSGPPHAYAALKRPHVVAEIQKAMHLQIRAQIAPAALATLHRLVVNDSGSTGPRVDASKFLMSLAGFVAPKAAEPESLSDDVLAELSTETLRNLIEKGTDVLAQRAKPVNATVVEVQDDKLLNLLD